MSGLKLAVVLLAAGKASRFEENKLLTEINKKKMIDHSIDVFLSEVETIIVVIGAYKEDMEDHLKNKNVQVVYNAVSEIGGMISSIRTGVQCLEKYDLDGIFIHPADIPFINRVDIRKMIDLMVKYSHSAS